MNDKKIFGIIGEYNPFHNGHLYQINKIKELYKPDIIIAIVTGYFSMRGEISALNKFDKTKIAIENGIDIIIELPYLLGTQNADIFAYNAVYLLNLLGVTNIVAGSESNDIEMIKDICSLEESKSFKEALKLELDKGNSLRKSYSIALEKHNYKNILSNDLLNIKYLKAINNINPIINFDLIKRINNNYFDIEVNQTNIQSATTIRGLSKISNFVPKLTNDIFLEKGFYDINKFSDILKHLIITKDLKNTFSAKEGIENLFHPNFDSIANLVEDLTSKRYKRSRILRFISYIITDTKKSEQIDLDIKLRVLGFNQNGQVYLNQIKKKVHYFTRLVNGINNVYDKELLIAKIFTNVFKEDFIKMEQSLPYIKK